MEQTMVPEIHAADALSNPDAEALALTGNNQTDLANIAKEMGVQIDANGNVVEQAAAPATTPAQVPQQAPVPGQAPQAAQPAPQAQVPPKFQNQDGSVNVEKLQKSEASLDDAIARYRAKEREFQQLQNKVNNAPMVQSQAQAQPQAVAVPLSPLEIQVAQDLLNEAAAQGVQLDQRLAIAQARVHVRLAEAKYSAELNATSDLRRRVEDNERARELQGLINSDPQLMSAEMVDTLWNVRQSNPWLNQAPEPWKAAYIHWQGSQGRAPQVQTPNPTGTTAKAPPTPVGPVTRVLPAVDVTDTKQLKEMPLDQLELEAKKLFPGLRGGPYVIKRVS